MKIIITLLLLSYLNAQELPVSHVKEVVDDIKILNEGNYTNALAPMCLVSSDNFASHSSVLIQGMFNRCAVDLCGTPKENVSVYITDDSYSKYLKSEISKDIDKQLPLIEKVIAKSLADNKKEYENIKSLIENPENAYLELSEGDKEELNSNIFSSFINIKYTDDKNIENRIKIDYQAPSWADDNFKKALKSFADNKKEQLLFDMESPEALKLKGDEYKLHLIGLFNKLDVAYKNNPHLHDETSLADLAELKKSISAPKISKEKFDEYFISATILQQGLFFNGAPIAGGPLCFIDECKAARALYFQSSDFKKPLEAYAKALADPSSKIQAQNRCKAALISQEIEASDEKKSAEIFKEAINLVKKNYLPKFSNHSRSMLENHLDNSITSTSDNVLAAAFTDRPNFLENFKSNAQVYLNARPQEPDSHTTLQNAFALKNNPSAADPSHGHHPCVSYANAVWDAFVSIEKLKKTAGKDSSIVVDDLKNKDRVFISAFSCQHADHGIHATGHEIGHALSAFFIHNKVSPSSAKFFSDSRKCVTNNYSNPPELQRKNFSHPGDTLLSEEDHADIMAFAAMADKKIYSCSFLKPSIIDNGYIDLDFNSNYGDPHSSPFSRMIHEAINKDISLPKSCRDLIQEVKPEMRFKKCI